MDLQKLLSLARRAIDDYDMIEEGDSIAVGLSGGTFFLCEMWSVKRTACRSPAAFTLHAFRAFFALAFLASIWYHKDTPAQTKRSVLCSKEENKLCKNPDICSRCCFALS